MCVDDVDAKPDVEGVINIVLVILVRPVTLSLNWCVVAALLPRLWPVNVNTDRLFICADELSAEFVIVIS